MNAIWCRDVASVRHGTNPTRLSSLYCKRQNPPLPFTKTKPGSRLRDQMKGTTMGFPARRLRRLRQNEAIRGLVRENRLSASNFILPLFVVPGSTIKREIASLPGNYHLSIDCLVEEAIAARDLGIPAVLLFGVPEPETKDELLS